METARPQSQTLGDVVAVWRKKRSEWFEDARIYPHELGPDTWAPILLETFDKIDRLVGRDPEYAFQITQIKEKLQTLRVYFRRNIGNETDLKIAAILEALRARTESPIDQVGE